MRFRFSLRWVLVAVGLVAIASAMWPTIHQAIVSSQLQGMGADIELDDDTGPWYERPPKSFVDHLDADITQIVWDSRRQNGKPKVVDDTAFTKMCGFSKVWNITLDDSTVTDKSIGEIRRLPLLAVLRLRHSQISDAGVETIVEHDRIENLVLANSRVTDTSVSCYQSLPKLYYLDLSGTAITDAAVPELVRNTHLTYLNVRGTNITPAGGLQLQQALPDCNIVH